MPKGGERGEERRGKNAVGGSGSEGWRSEGRKRGGDELGEMSNALVALWWWWWRI